MFARRIASLALAIGLLIATAFAARPAAAAPAPGAAVPNEYIVVFKDNVIDVDQRVQALAARHGLTVDFIYSHALKGFAGLVPAGVLARLRAEPEVAFIEQNRVVSIDAQTIPTGINRIGGPSSPTARINGVDERVNVDVAVIDTGIQTNHPDLNVVGGKNCIGFGSSYNDQNGHGTHVAGTIGAIDNGSGVVGVAPGARLWAVRVLNRFGSGTTATVNCGIDWVAANAGTIDVANMSLGGSGSDDGNCGYTNNDSEHKAICNAVGKGVTFVVAAGNDHDNAANHIPAAYDEVITVSALADFNGVPGGGAAPTCRTDQDDTLADFSNFGPDVDVIAPGVCIYSTYVNSGYATLSGTSMASPHAAGAAALYKATHPSATPAQVKSALQSAGNLNWNNSDDPDGIKEKLIDVSTF